ncbi:flippase activity-associated protein Agl23 [Haloquadratum walsbyi]|jgi:conserved hypothetical protein TIGR03663|uniref:TIGR03663 family protein n=1 Tax=Haloquadratum walsbyi J07HQW2 TaxID=1238425 RepID=U1PS83_9EURY|nr:flippase activity-associated protein Agl23 [Haloquadratum walsbyi]ERG96657.1 MAG: TIGR03663 family protein [Haloquadratum walsbyi J07HQW2]
MNSDEVPEGAESLPAGEESQRRTTIGSRVSTLPVIDAIRAQRTLVGVVTATVFALVLRLNALGGRVFHWDEGRVGYWILRYHETGIHTYRPIVHGPFIPIVDRWLFEIAPITDATARLPIAVIGGLLPLAALLFREHLRDIEIISLATLLAINPLVVYYSRFMRNDVLVATFAFIALGAVIRGLDTGHLRYSFAAAVALALAFTTKENALLYPVCYIGAAVVVVDWRLTRAVAREESHTHILSEWKTRIYVALTGHGTTPGMSLARIGCTFIGSLVLFIAIFTFFYAPRPDLWQAIANPTQLPDTITAGTIGAAEKFIDLWATGGRQDHAYLPYFHDLVETLVYGAPALLSFGLLGIITNRYGVITDRRRPLITFATYWAVASLLGYPLATDIQAPWVTIHIIVPLAIPAAVGLSFVIESAHDALMRINTDTVTAGLAILIILAAAGGVAGANATYFNSASADDKQVLQWAQPENDLKSSMLTTGAIAASNAGTDVLFVGTTPPSASNTDFYVDNESSVATAPPGGPAWHSRLPLPWYLERTNATITSTDPDTELETALSDPPPVVISKGHDRDAVSATLQGYTASEHNFRLWGETVVIFIHDETRASVIESPQKSSSSVSSPSESPVSSTHNYPVSIDTET